MEKAANAVLSLCKHASSGHEITATHRRTPQRAVSLGLTPAHALVLPVNGKAPWMHQHKTITSLQREDIVFLATDMNRPGAVNWVMMQSCSVFHTMLVLAN